MFRKSWGYLLKLLQVNSYREGKGNPCHLLSISTSFSYDLSVQNQNNDFKPFHRNQIQRLVLSQSHTQSPFNPPLPPPLAFDNLHAPSLLTHLLFLLLSIVHRTRFIAPPFSVSSYCFCPYRRVRIPVPFWRERPASSHPHHPPFPPHSLSLAVRELPCHNNNNRTSQSGNPWIRKALAAGTVCYVAKRRLWGLSG